MSQLEPHIYIAVKGSVFDVSKSAALYGKGGEYHVFAGRDASRCLALQTLSEEDAVSGDISNLAHQEMEVLDSQFRTRSCQSFCLHDLCACVYFC